MPELPEVETIRAQLADELCGARVVDAGSHPSAKFSDAPAVIGARLETVSRRGKYLLVATDDDRDLIIHLGMTGSLAISRETPMTLDDHGLRPHRRAWWALEDGRTLDFDDPRRFGRIAVVPTGVFDRLPTLASLGPEPLDASFTPEVLYHALRAQRRHVKTALLSQRVVAGVGNIYADEALWRARINPMTRRIGLERSTRLHGAIVDVLTAAIDHGGTRLRNYRSVEGDTGRHQFHLATYGRAGLACRRCGTVLTHRVVDARGTTWCPLCQAR